MKAPPLHAVIIAGGAGERFWPQSRRRRPKPLLAPLGGKTLLELSLERARALAPPERIWLVCTEENARPLGSGAQLPPRHVWSEPRGRDTAMAIGLAATRLAARDPEAVMAVLPADQWVPDRRAFSAAMRRASSAVARADALVTLGVQPTRAETGYGYLRIGRAAGPDFPGFFRVARFVEKPDARRARRFCADGRYLWNAGIFVWKARVVLEELRRHAPGVYRALGPVRARPEGPGSRRARERAYRRAPKVSIDFALLERSERVWTQPVDFAWSDIGNWAALAQALGVDRRRSVTVAGRALYERAVGNLVWGGRRPVALVGVDGVAVIDTDDALLIVQLERSGDLKRVVRRVATEFGTEFL